MQRFLISCAVGLGLLLGAFAPTAASACYYRYHHRYYHHYSAFRNRVLAIPHRVEYLSARQTLALTQELRACLDELADGKGA